MKDRDIYILVGGYATSGTGKRYVSPKDLILLHNIPKEALVKCFLNVKSFAASADYEYRLHCKYIDVDTPLPDKKNEGEPMIENGYMWQHIAVFPFDVAETLKGNRLVVKSVIDEDFICVLALGEEVRIPKDNVGKIYRKGEVIWTTKYWRPL